MYATADDLAGYVTPPADVAVSANAIRIKVTG